MSDQDDKDAVKTDNVAAPPDAPQTEAASEPTGPPTYPPKRIEIEHGEHNRRQTATVHRHTKVRDLLELCHEPTDGTRAIKAGGTFSADAPDLHPEEEIYHEVSHDQKIKIHQVAKDRAGHGLATKPVVSGN